MESGQPSVLSCPENRICRICNERLSECVDHIIDHDGDEKLFWDQSNWQPPAYHATRERLTKASEVENMDVEDHEKSQSNSKS